MFPLSASWGWVWFFLMRLQRDGCLVVSSLHFMGFVESHQAAEPAGSSLQAKRGWRCWRGSACGKQTSWCSRGSRSSPAELVRAVGSSPYREGNSRHFLIFISSGLTDNHQKYQQNQTPQFPLRQNGTLILTLSLLCFHHKCHWKRWKGLISVLWFLDISLRPQLRISQVLRF